VSERLSLEDWRAQDAGQERMSLEEFRAQPPRNYLQPDASIGPESPASPEEQAAARQGIIAQMDALPPAKSHAPMARLGRAGQAVTDKFNRGMADWNTRMGEQIHAATNAPIPGSSNPIAAVGAAGVHHLNALAAAVLSPATAAASMAQEVAEEKTGGPITSQSLLTDVRSWPGAPMAVMEGFGTGVIEPLSDLAQDELGLSEAAAQVAIEGPLWGLPFAPKGLRAARGGVNAIRGARAADAAAATGKRAAATSRLVARETGPAVQGRLGGAGPRPMAPEQIAARKAQLVSEGVLSEAEAGIRRPPRTSPEPSPLVDPSVRLQPSRPNVAETPVMEMGKRPAGKPAVSVGPRRLQPRDPIIQGLIDDGIITEAEAFGEFGQPYEPTLRASEAPTPRIGGEPLSAADDVTGYKGPQERAGAGLSPREDGTAFHRGTVPGSTKRIVEPFEAGRGKTFVARRAESAKMYGPDIETVRATPGAKILYQEDAAFWELMEWKKPPNGSVMSVGMPPVDAVNFAIRKAEAAGYDAVSFMRDSDIGTVILNEEAFVRNARTPGSTQTFPPGEGPRLGRREPAAIEWVEPAAKPGEGQLVRVSVDKVDQSLQQTPELYVGEGGAGRIGGRQAAADEFIRTQEGKGIEAGVLALDGDGNAVFSDGRHRFAAARDAGQTHVDVFVENAVAGEVQAKFGDVPDPAALPRLTEADVVPPPSTTFGGGRMGKEAGSARLPVDITPAVEASLDVPRAIPSIIRSTLRTIEGQGSRAIKLGIDYGEPGRVIGEGLDQVFSTMRTGKGGSTAALMEAEMNGLQAAFAAKKASIWERLTRARAMRKRGAEHIRRIKEAKEKPSNPYEVEMANMMQREGDFIADTGNEVGIRIPDKIRAVKIRKKIAKGKPLSEYEMAVVEDWNEAAGYDIIEKTNARRADMAKINGRIKATKDPKAKAALRKIVAEMKRKQRADFVIMKSRLIPRGTKTYFPRVVDPEIRAELRMEKGPEKYAARRRELQEANPTKTLREKALTEIEIDTLMESYSSPEMTGFFAGLERPRRLNIPEDWHQADGYASWRTYTERAWEAIAEQKQWKWRDPKTRVKPKSGAKRKPGDYVNDFEKEIGKAKKTGDSEGLRRDYERTLGKHEADAGQAVKRKLAISEGLGLFNAARLFVGNVRTSAIQASQLSNLYTVAGEKVTVQAVAESLAQMKKGRLTLEAVRSGAADPHGFHRVAGYAEDATGRTMQRVQGALDVGMLPISKHDIFWRAVTNNAAEPLAVKWGATLRETKGLGLKRRQKMVLRQLTEMDMTPSEIAEIKSGNVSSRTMNRLKQKLVDHTQVGAGRESKLRAQSSKKFLYKTFFQLKQFPIGEARFAYKSIVKEAARGNVAPLFRYTTSRMAIAVPVRALLEGIFGPLDDAPSWAEILDADDPTTSFKLLMERAKDDMKLLSFIGLYGDAGMALFEAFMEGGQKGSHFMTNLLMPPTADTVEDIWKAGQRTAADLGDEDAEFSDILDHAAGLFEDQFMVARYADKLQAYWTEEGARDKVKSLSKRGPSGFPMARKGKERLRRRWQDRVDTLR